MKCSMCSWEDDRKKFPSISYFDIYNYCVVRESIYTHEEFRALKSLEGYQFFAAGWVKNVKVKYTDTNAVLVGDVSINVIEAL